MRKLCFAVLMVLVSACGQRAESTTTATTETTTTTAASSTATNATDTTANATAATATTSAAPARQEKPMSDYEGKVAEIHTTAGDITIGFFPEKAPNHVRNFLDLAQSGFYNGTKFHRVIPGFMIQGGDPNTKTADTSTWGHGNGPNRLKAEFNDIPHVRGTVSMARLGNDVNSASSQFFICVADARRSLDGQYSAFGKVLKGMDVADKIVSAPRDPDDRPNNPTAINSITVRPATAEEKAALTTK